MSTKKKIEENALPELSDQKLAQLSGGSLLDPVLGTVAPVLGTVSPVLGTVSQVTGPVLGAVGGTKVGIGGVQVQSPLANISTGGIGIGLGG